MPTIFRRGSPWSVVFGAKRPAFAASRLENERANNVKAGISTPRSGRFSVYQRWLGEMRLLDAGSGSEGDEGASRSNDPAFPRKRWGRRLETQRSVGRQHAKNVAHDGQWRRKISKAAQAATGLQRAAQHAPHNDQTNPPKRAMVPKAPADSKFQQKGETEVSLMAVQREQNKAVGGKGVLMPEHILKPTEIGCFEGGRDQPEDTQ